MKTIPSGKGGSESNYLFSHFFNDDRQIIRQDGGGSPKINGFCFSNP
jgi:hypothetical protein